MESFFETYLEQIKKQGVPGRKNLLAHSAETNRLLEKWQVYRKRCGLDMIESFDIKGDIQFGYELIMEGGDSND